MNLHQFSIENNTSLPTILFYDVIVDKAHLTKLREITSHDFKEGHTRMSISDRPLDETKHHTVRGIDVLHVYSEILIQLFNY